MSDFYPVEDDSESIIIEGIHVYRKVLSKKVINKLMRGYPGELYFYEIPKENGNCILMISSVKQTSELLKYVGTVDLTDMLEASDE